MERGGDEDKRCAFKTIALIISVVFGGLFTIAGGIFLIGVVESSCGSASCVGSLICAILVLAAGLIQFLVCIIALKNKFENSKVVFWHIGIAILCLIIVILYFIVRGGSRGYSSYIIGWAIFDMILIVVGIVLLMFVFKS